MRSGFVLTTIVVAIALGIVGGASESRLLTRGLIVGFVPAIWAVSHVFEWLTGRDMWHFTAPYPYRWMRDEGGSASSRRRVIPESKAQPIDPEDPDALPVAA